MSDWLFKRLYERSLAQLLVPLGYRQLGDAFWRDRDRIIHVIQLDRYRATDFTAYFGVIPLVCYFDVFSYGFGTRVSCLFTW